MFAMSFVVGLFSLIIVASLVDRHARQMPWHRALVFGEAFRVDDQKLLLPIMRRCDGPSVDISYFTPEDRSVTTLTNVVNDCGSVLSNWLTSRVPVELSVNALSTSANRLHAVVQNENFVEVPVVNHRLTSTNTSNTTESSNGTGANTHNGNDFTVCVLRQPFSTPLKSEIDKVEAIPQIAAFFESWLYYGATNFIIYDTEYDVASPLAELYNDTAIEMPFYNKKQVLQENFPDANVFYAYDCLLRSRLTKTTKWTVLTSFDEIPIVLTRSSLANALALLATPGSAYSIANGRTDQTTIQIFDAQEVKRFDDDANVIYDRQIAKAPTELLETLNILQLSADIFQQPSSSPMNQVFSLWIQKYRLRVSKAGKDAASITK
uniref:Glycosyltransferase family 10 protein n=1 Tax=Panagrellus redivivus TaxID=6233 RepID=A0A7E4VWS1_PANRE